MRVSSPSRAAESFTGSSGGFPAGVMSSSIAPTTVDEANIRTARGFMTPFQWLIFLLLQSASCLCHHFEE